MSNKTAQYDVARQNYALNGKIMLCSVVVLVAAVFLLFSFHTYARCLLRRRSRRLRRRHHLFFPAGADLAGAPAGLDPAVVNSLPTFAYSAAAHDPLLECAVCLSEFQNDEAGRVLPKCGHTFHADCIDLWFRFHSNCPLCRAPVQAAKPEILGHTVVVVGEPEGAGFEPGSSSNSAAPPVEAAEEGSGSAELKESGSRVLTLKRIWSV